MNGDLRSQFAEWAAEEHRKAAARRHMRNMLGTAWRFDDPTAVFGDDTHPMLKIGPVAVVTRVNGFDDVYLSDTDGNTIEVQQDMLPRIAERVR